MTGLAAALEPPPGAPTGRRAVGLPPQPMLGLAVALIAGIWLAEFVGRAPDGWRPIIFWLPVAGGLVLLTGLRWPLRAPLTVGLLTSVAFTVGFARYQNTFYQSANHIARTLPLEPVLTRLAGRLVTPPIERPPLKLNPFLPLEPTAKTQFVVAVDEVRAADPALPAVGNVRVSVDDGGLALRLGQRVELTGSLWRPAGPRSPGEPDWSRWYRLQGIDAGMSVPGRAHVCVLPDPLRPWPRFVTALRQRARSLLYEPYADLQSDESARLLDVMILGQRSVADRALNEAFLRAGGMHFLAVSGFNVMILAGATWWLARRVLRQHDRVAAVLAVIVTLLFAALTEPNAPILRATVAVLVLALARATGRPSCAINSLALAATAILLLKPNELFSAAFQLTFVQVLVLVEVVPRVYRTCFHRGRYDDPPAEARNIWQLARRKIARGAAALAFACLCTWLSALPLVLWHFGRFTPWGWLGTIPLTPLVTLVTILSLATMAVAAVLPPTGVWLGHILQWWVKVLLASVGLFENFPRAIIETQPPPTWLVLVTYGVLLTWLLMRRRAQRPKQSSPARGSAPGGGTLVSAGILITLMLTWAGWAVLPARHRTDYVLHVLPAGDGAATVLAAPDGSAAVIDVGTNTNSDAGVTAARALRASGVRQVDAAVISHGNVDHFSGLPSLMEHMPVQRWLTNADLARMHTNANPTLPAVAALRAACPPPATLRAGDHLTIGDAELDVLWPPADLDPRWSVNDCSLVIRLTTAGRTVLLPGDIEAPAMNVLLDAEHAGRLSLKADVLIAPHHGQVIVGLTANWLAAVSPQAVIVSSRTPRPKLIALVAEVLGPQARTLLTGEVGAIAVHVSPDGGLTIETPYAPVRF